MRGVGNDHHQREMTMSATTKDEPDYRHVELYETNGGDLWVVVGTEAISMPRSGDFLTDARLYGESWDETEVADEDRWGAAELEAENLDERGYRRNPAPYTRIASYRSDRDEVVVEKGRDGRPLAGFAGREYLGIDAEGEPVR